MQVNWQRFVALHGAGMPSHYLAGVVSQPVAAVARARAGTSRPRQQAQIVPTFVDLFSRWNGRVPDAGDWPAPMRSGCSAFHWLPPEDELLASMVGVLERADIAKALTVRLRKITGDRQAVRSAYSVQVRMNRLGLQASDVVGGITVQAAGAEIGSVEIVRNAIRAAGGLRTRRHGRLIVIPHAEWERWKATRAIAPPGYIRLASLRIPLGISSDSKLPEFAAAGYIPTAIRCNPAKPGVHSGKFGTWHIDPKVGRKLVADRHAGRPMPWHGKPLRENLKHSWRRWQDRKHPNTCTACRAIWGTAGAPQDFESYCKRYPQLDFGAKRHLTLKWSEGLNVTNIARQARLSRQIVLSAIRNGALRARQHGRSYFAAKTDVTRWIARRCPNGTGRGSWISIATGMRWYGFKRKEIEALIAAGKLKDRREAGKRLVLRQQLAELRQDLGYTEKQAAALTGTTLATFRELLAGVHWRQKGLIPHVTVQAVTKRIKSQQGHTIPQAAAACRKSPKWVQDRIKDGTIRVTRARWDRRRIYITNPMLARLKLAAKRKQRRNVELSNAWNNLAIAARLAGVSTTTVNNWRCAGEVRVRQTDKGVGVRFSRVSIMARARRHWRTCRRTRARPPEWLRAELEAKNKPRRVAAL